MPKTFSINLNDRTKERLNALNGAHGDKANIIRLAMTAELIKMTPARYALAHREPGPHTHKFTIRADTKRARWLKALNAKADELDTTPSQLARVCLSLFLSELEAVESGQDNS